jgi:uncharacterized protein
MIPRLVLAALVLGGLAALENPLAAQVQMPFLMGGSDGISVSGAGELSARPNLVEIDLHVAGKAELTGDALVKYRDAKKRVLEALDKLKLKGLSSDELGLTISAGTGVEQQQRMMNGMPQAPSKTQIEVSCTLRVRLKDVRDQPPEELIKTVGKLIDVAQDSGVTIGPSPAQVMMNMRFGNYTNNTAPVRFVVSDLTELREKAYELAVADARSRAGRLAKLNQVKLGRALSVQEISVAGEQVLTNRIPGTVQSAEPVLQDEDDTPRITSSALASIPVQVKLMVRFAIVAPEPATAQQ